MEPWKQRFIQEYNELKVRIERLDAMLKAWDEGTLSFTPKCPRTLLFHQLHTMQVYASILEQRAVIEEVDLNGTE